MRITNQMDMCPPQSTCWALHWSWSIHCCPPSTHDTCYTCVSASDTADSLRFIETDTVSGDPRESAWRTRGRKSGGYSWAHTPSFPLIPPGTSPWTGSLRMSRPTPRPLAATWKARGSRRAPRRASRACTWQPAARWIFVRTKLNSLKKKY